MNRTFSVKEHCFSLTINQRTVLFNLFFQQNEQVSIDVVGAITFNILLETPYDICVASRQVVSTVKVN